MAQAPKALCKLNGNGSGQTAYTNATLGAMLKEFWLVNSNAAASSAVNVTVNGAPLFPTGKSIGAYTTLPYGPLNTFIPTGATIVFTAPAGVYLYCSGWELS